MAASELIRIVVADDHRMFLDGLQRLFEGQDDLQIVACAQSGREALDAIIRHRPDIALLDIDMPDMNAFAVVDRLADESVESRVILLTMHDETPYLLAASRPDIHGFVLKDAAFDELIDAIRQVHAGKRYIGSGIGKTANAHTPLSPREREVLQCAGRGLTIQQTADQLGLSVKTIETHRAHILRKLQVANITEAIHVTSPLGDTL